MTTRDDFYPSEICTHSIRQIAVANDPNAIQGFDLSCASDGRQQLILYLRNLTMIVENLVVDVLFDGFQSFELLCSHD